MLLTSLLVLWDVQGASSHHQKANSAAREDSRPPAETDPDFSGAHLPEASISVSIYDSLCSAAVKKLPKTLTMLEPGIWRSEPVFQGRGHYI